jgi:predicted CXXCH cytochrome family protein
MRYTPGRLLGIALVELTLLTLAPAVAPPPVAVIAPPNPAPHGRTQTRYHPLVARTAGCGQCHDTSRRNGLEAVGPVNFAACLSCHRAAQFETTHAHPLDPLKHCSTCHAPHGSSLKGLLKAPAKKLCASCHDS